MSSAASRKRRELGAGLIALGLTQDQINYVHQFSKLSDNQIESCPNNLLRAGLAFHRLNSLRKRMTRMTWLCSAEYIGLQPCPFCGKEGRAKEDIFSPGKWSIRCTQCTARTKVHPNAKKAEAHWNFGTVHLAWAATAEEGNVG